MLKTKNSTSSIRSHNSKEVLILTTCTVDTRQDNLIINLSNARTTRPSTRNGIKLSSIRIQTANANVQSNIQQQQSNNMDNVLPHFQGCQTINEARRNILFPTCGYFFDFLLHSRWLRETRNATSNVYSPIWANTITDFQGCNGMHLRDNRGVFICKGVLENRFLTVWGS